MVTKIDKLHSHLRKSSVLSNRDTMLRLFCSGTEEDTPSLSGSGAMITGTNICGMRLGSFEKTRRCGACRIYRYCSAECQKKHWPQHKISCPRLKSNDKSFISGLCFKYPANLYIKAILLIAKETGDLDILSEKCFFFYPKDVQDIENRIVTRDTFKIVPYPERPKEVGGAELRSERPTGVGATGSRSERFGEPRTPSTGSHSEYETFNTSTSNLTPGQKDIIDQIKRLDDTGKVALITVCDDTPLSSKGERGYAVSTSGDGGILKAMFISLNEFISTLRSMVGSDEKMYPD